MYVSHRINYLLYIFLHKNIKFKIFIFPVLSKMLITFTIGFKNLLIFHNFKFYGQQNSEIIKIRNIC